MTARTLLVILPTLEDAERVLPHACALARRTDAHLIGLNVIEALMTYPAGTMYATIPDMTGYIAAQKERAERINAVFEAATSGEDFVAEWRCCEARGGGAGRAAADLARIADLVIAPQARPDDPGGDQADALGEIVRECGRPVLVIPYAGAFDEIGARPLIGWSATREAARAVHDAFDVFTADAQATILTVGPADAPDASARDLAAVLDRRGVGAHVVRRDANGVAIGDVLLNEAAETNADLIVTGAFGHSRIYDLVIGAVTSRLMKSMTAPVLFSS